MSPALTTVGVHEPTPAQRRRAAPWQGNRAGRRMLGVPEGADVRGARIPNLHPAWAYQGNQP